MAITVGIGPRENGIINGRKRDMFCGFVHGISMED